MEGTPNINSCRDARSMFVLLDGQGIWYSKFRDLEDKYYTRTGEGSVIQQSAFSTHQDFGLSHDDLKDKHVYLCAQSLFKLAPEFDQAAELIEQLEEEAGGALGDGGGGGGGGGAPPQRTAWGDVDDDDEDEPPPPPPPKPAKPAPKPRASEKKEAAPTRMAWKSDDGDDDAAPSAELEAAEAALEAAHANLDAAYRRWRAAS